MSNITTSDRLSPFLFKLLLLVLSASITVSFFVHSSNSNIRSAYFEQKTTNTQRAELSRHTSHNHFTMDSNENQLNTNPLYITVAPQCSGKTTLLGKNNITDVTIDEQNGVYYSVPLRYFIKPTKDDKKQMNDTIINGKSLKERIKAQNFDEILFVSKRAVRRSTSTNGKDQGWKKDLEKMFKLDKDEKNNTSGSNDKNTSNSSNEKNNELSENNKEKKLFKDFKEAVKEFGKKTKDKDCEKVDPSKLQYDLFIPEGLFGENGGISKASAQLLELAFKHPDHPIAWGNTNTLARDYQAALDVAMKTRRPVHFIIFGDKRKGTKDESQPPHKKIKTISNDSECLSLPKKKRKELMYRNLERFYNTGRYIPIRSLAQSMDRCDSLLSSATGELKSIRNNFPNMEEEWYFDYVLCQLAGYEMDAERYVTKKESSVGSNNTANQCRNKNGALNKSSSMNSNKRHDSTTFSHSLSKRKKNKSNFKPDNTDKASKTTKM